MDKDKWNEWIDVRRCMPPVDQHYEIVTSAYQSGRVAVKTRDGKQFAASLQLYGNSIDGWKSEWWLDGLLSSGESIEDVICWRPLDIYDDGNFYQTFEEIRND